MMNTHMLHFSSPCSSRVLWELQSSYRPCSQNTDDTRRQGAAGMDDELDTPPLETFQQGAFMRMHFLFYCWSYLLHHISMFFAASWII